MTFGIRKSFKESWEIFSSKKVYWWYVLATLLVVVAVYAMMAITIAAFGFAVVRIPLLLVVGLLVLYFITYSILVSVNLPLHVYRERRVSIKRTFSEVWNFKLIMRGLGLLAIVAIVMGGGALVLFWLGGKFNPIIGGVLMAVWAAYIAVRWAFGFYVLIDKKKSAIESLKESHKLMQNNNGWKFLWFIILISCISLAVQLVANLIGLASGSLAAIFTAAISIFLFPWFSLVSMSPYMQLTK